MTALSKRRSAVASPLVIALAQLYTIASCEPGQIEHGTLTVEQGVRILDVPAPRIDRGGTIAPLDEWAADLPIIMIADARLLKDGSIVLVDEKASEAWLLPASKRDPLKFASRGKGPGESEGIIAVAPLTSAIALWAPSDQVFNLFDSDGRFVRSALQPEDGDTDRFRRRRDGWRRQANYQLRLRATDDWLWLQLEDDEFELAPAQRNLGIVEVPRVGYLTRFVPGMEVLDTILSFPVAPRQLEVGGPSYGTPLFSAAPLWAVQDNFAAMARTDSAQISVYALTGQLVAVVRWKPTERPLGPDDKRRHARAVVRERSWDFRGQPEALDEDKLNEAADRMSAAEFAPELTGLELLGRCVWVSPFDVRDNSDGVSRTWWFYNLDTAESGAVTFDSQSTRPMHFTTEYVVGRHIDDEGRHILHRYRLPESVRQVCRMP